MTNTTVGAGMIASAALHVIRGTEVEIDRQARALQKGQRPRVLWLTAPPGVEKSAIARLVEKKLYSFGRHTYILDENSEKLGNSVAGMARILTDAGLIVLIAVETPLRKQRDSGRELFAPEEFVEIFLDAPAGTGERPANQFKPPENAEITIAAAGSSAEELAERIVTELYGGLLAPDKLLGAGI